MIAAITNFFSTDSTWAGIVVLIIIGLFIAACAIGMIAQLIMPEKYSPPEKMKHGRVTDGK